MWNDALEATVGAQDVREPTVGRRDDAVQRDYQDDDVVSERDHDDGDALAQNSGAAWSDLYIGQKGPTTGADYKMQGHIGDILIYNSVLSSSDRMSVEAWLSEKYGFGVSV